VAGEVRALLEQPERRQAMKADLAEVRRRLGEKGASRRAAEAVGEVLSAQSRKA
jgi:lipid A disaccharide synthetase